LGEFKHEVLWFSLWIQDLVNGVAGLVFLFGFGLITIAVMTVCVPFEIILRIGDWISPDPNTEKQGSEHADRS
jgi:hypothetical protein